MVGLPTVKAPPQDGFIPEKPGLPENPPLFPPLNVDPPPAPKKRRTLDVAIHTASGTVIDRFEEVAPGQWKLVAQLTPEKAAKDDDLPAPKAAPKAEPEAKKAE
jgi:hypothetical protein